MCEEYNYVNVERTESAQKLSSALRAALDSALHVNQTLRDVTGRAWRLDVSSDVTLDVMRDSARLQRLLLALSMTHRPLYACWLWAAARNLVRDVIGHVTSYSGSRDDDDLEGRLEVKDKDERRRTVRRTAAQLDLLCTEPAHIHCMIHSYMSTIVCRPSVDILSGRHLNFGHFELKIIGTPVTRIAGNVRLF